MSFNERPNLYDAIPGFDASKGERIVRALQRLWAKIEHLEQIRHSEKTPRSSKVHASLNDKDLSLTDVQFKLLVLQLQYIRRILRKNRAKSSVDLNENGGNEENMPVDNFMNMNLNDVDGDQANIRNEETQTGVSLFGDNLNFDIQLNENDGGENRRLNDDKISDTGLNKRSVADFTHERSNPSSRPHYHMRLDDVPFIVGASSSSHSVVAAVQNIIAKMKLHNKALCGSKPHSQPQNSSAPRNNSNKCEDQDLNKIIQKFSQEVTALKHKQENLEERFSKAAKSDMFQHSNIANKKTNSDQVMLSNKPRSVPDSVPSRHHATNKQSFSSRENEILKRSQRQIVPNSRIQSRNMPVGEGRKFMRSLRDFKIQLSKEDIVWD